jgi:putative addiction module component (TIGR02574 family)
MVMSGRRARPRADSRRGRRSYRVGGEARWEARHRADSRRGGAPTNSIRGRSTTLPGKRRAQRAQWRMSRGRSDRAPCGRRSLAIIPPVHLRQAATDVRDPMNTKEIVDSALRLGPTERLAVIEELLRSLDRPDPELDRIWIEEAERRLAAYRAGRVKGIAAEDVVGKF